MRKCVSKFEVFEDVESGELEVMGFTNLSGAVCIMHACNDFFEAADIEYLKEKYKKEENK